MEDRLYYAAGFGGNYIIIDETHNMVMVIRWLEPGQTGELVKMVLDSLN